MPASVRTLGSRTTPSRPYDRRASTASPVSGRSPPPASPVQVLDADTNQNLPEPEPEPGIPPDHPGLPTYADYKRIESGYLLSLSPRKRDKALITQAMFDKIWDVLHQPDACTVETPQFRFWVRKMFTLSRPVRWGLEARAGAEAETHPSLLDPDSDAEEDALELERAMRRRSTADAHTLTAVVLHENRPVAIVEQLYDLFCYCHVRAGHGGRDKTCAVIRAHYSWVPKELTAQFVKACPTCAVKRSGQAHGGVGVDVGALTHRRTGGRAKRGRAVPCEVGVEESSAPVESLAWLTTGGPLDPVNPEVHERECERERAWTRVRGDAGTIDTPSPDSLALDSRAWSMPREAPRERGSQGGWSSIPRTLTLDAPFHACDTPGHPFAVNNGHGRRHREDADARSPTKTELPSLARALSNESLDEPVSLTGLGPRACVLPPVLRPLRLLGPVASDSATESDPARASCPLQIDPVLLSFNYPGLGPSSEPGGASDAADGMHRVDGPPGLAVGTLSEAHAYGVPSYPGSCRLRAPLSMRVPALALDSPDARLEHAMVSSYTTDDGAAPTLPLSLSMEFRATVRSRCGPRCGYRDGPLAMGCSADEARQELDGPLFFSIMTDA